MFSNEKVFKGERDVKYVFNKSYDKTEGLIILFSGFQPKNKPPAYNYGKTIEEFDCNKLFILDDFGARGSYYLCQDRDFSIERSVIELIYAIIEENDIKTVITAGSSKGGFAALYYGIKYGFDYIVSASPQYLIGDYLLMQSRTNEVVKFMSGNDDEDDHRFLNAIMKDMLRQTSNKPNIFIHLGKGERHYHQHVIPMMSDLDSVGLHYTLDLGNYDRHNDVGRFFQPILKSKIRNYLNFPDLQIKMEGIDNQFKYTALTEAENKVAWYVYKNNEKIEARSYAEVKTLSVQFGGTGTYKVKGFVKNELGHKTSKFSNEIIIK